MNLKDAGLLQTRCLIGGQWQDADHGKTLAVTNPATGETVAHVPDMGTGETRRAIAAAEAARADWAGRTARQRADILRRWFALMTEHTDDLAIILSTEQGKPLAEARGEIAYGASYLAWYAEEALRLYGDIIPGNAPGQRILVLRQPVGVCAAITPWNFPCAMIARKAAPALAAGCTFVVRPASATPLSALALGELAQRAGVPPGVFNVLTGSSRTIGAELTASNTVKKFSFTGSTETGRLLLAQCAPTIKKVSMELGGNAPFIVFDDADLDAAVSGALAAKFRNAGQTCVCANRIYVQAGLHDRFVEKLAAAMQQLRVGNGLDEGVTIGPLIDDSAVAKVREHIDDAVARGGRLVTGGRPHALGGLFFQPTLVSHVPQTARVAREETFGPLAPVFRFDTEEEVIRWANDTEFGLAAYVYTRNLGRSIRMAEALEYGMVAINSGALSNEAAPFGGIKQSGLGREGSKYGMDDYVDMKYVLLGGLEG